MNYFTRSLVIAFACYLTNCTSSGDGNSGQKIDQNACDVLGLNSKIVNGTACTPENSPVVELLITYSDATGGFCSGTLLTPQHVLTAAHCFLKDTVAISVGNNSLKRDATEILIHPGFSPNTSTGALNNDAAIVKLGAPLALPTLPLLHSRAVESGDTIAIFGFGKDDNGNLQVLRSGEMEVSDTTANHILAIFDGQGSNTCNGDSGGPALGQTTTGAWGVIGITSTGTSATCSIGDNSLFTNLASDSVFQFITQNVPGVGSI